MDNYSVRGEMCAYFDMAGQTGLMLPSGWFGRPHDNLLRLTTAKVAGNWLALEFEGIHLLTFEGKLQCSTSDDGLRLQGFTRLTWDWTEWASNTRRHEEFTSGEVRLARPIS